VRRIIYCSQSTIDFSPDELVELLEAARHHNAESQLSGMLLYCSQSFLQMLEGDPAALEETYGRITRDERHNNLRLLMDTEIASRMFADWTMGFAHLDEDELADELDGYVAETDHPLVNPDLITSGEVAKRLLALYAENRVAR
jgi:Sensors of blue-light using FAD